MQTERVPTRKQKRAALRNENQIIGMKLPNFELKKIQPMTDNQRIAFEEYEFGHLVMQGCPGTGKTFLAMYLGLQEAMSNDSKVNKIVVIRSATPVKQLGFLPGKEGQKVEVYEKPYVDHAAKLFGRGDAYSILKQKGLVEFNSTSFLRGTEYENCVLIVEEFQNMTFQELYTVLTRVGENCKIVLCGDTKQDDLSSDRFKEYSGGTDMLRVLDKMDEDVYIVNFTVDDIVRSGFVKSLVKAKESLGL
jgi:predicted ribonuclease YlaK